MEEATFGRYRLLSVIGEGGMGKVYKAHDTVIGRDVAIKVLATELGAEPGYRERFRREAHTAARLTEPHIIPIHDTGEIDGRLYLVMPVIDGIDVSGLLARDGPMSPQRAVAVVEQLAAALNAAHRAGLVHRDIKPSNALVTGLDFVYLIDFGIAHDAAATKLTSTGMMVGTLAYMAPERFTTGTADARADIYALACVLYECLTGDQPFPGNSVEQQIAGHLTLDPPKPSGRDPALAGFDEVIATGMAKNPDQRYQNAHDLATAARHALTGTTSPIAAPLPHRPALPHPPVQAPGAWPRQHAPQQPVGPLVAQPAPGGGRNRWLLGLSAVVAAAVLVGVGIYFAAKKSNNTAISTPVPTTTMIEAPPAQAGPTTPATSTATANTPTSASAPAEVAGLAPFVGTWRAHAQTVVIQSTGSGHLSYADLTACPTCAVANAPTATVDFTLTSVSNEVATGSVTASTDEQNEAVGAPVTAQLAAGSPSGQILKMSMGKMQEWPFCNNTSAGQCGA
ncbi:MAG: serine/threonine protein kinase [Mycobacteriaceae bacterium]|nr:serine/threonine protein kinase [Mycobacteriaceae bacterium]